MYEALKTFCQVYETVARGTSAASTLSDSRICHPLDNVFPDLIGTLKESRSKQSSGFSISISCSHCVQQLRAETPVEHVHFNFSQLRHSKTLTLIIRKLLNMNMVPFLLETSTYPFLARLEKPLFYSTSSSMQPLLLDHNLYRWGH